MTVTKFKLTFNDIGTNFIQNYSDLVKQKSCENWTILFRKS